METTMNMMNRVELTDEELELIDGAGWLDDAWNATKNFVAENKKTIISVSCMVAGAALCATGAGAAAGAGLISVGVCQAAVVAGMAGMTVAGTVAEVVQE